MIKNVETNNGILQGELVGAVCPHCKVVLDGFSVVSGNCLPEVDDYTVCSSCCEILRFGEGLSLNALSEDDELLGLDFIAVQNAQETVRLMQEKKERVHKPKIITELFAWVCTEGDGGEGIPAIEINGMVLPLMGADLERMESLRKHAFGVARSLPVKLVKFSTMEVLEEL